MTDVRIVNDDGSEIVRAREIAVASLELRREHHVRVGRWRRRGRDDRRKPAHHDEHRPDYFHRQLVRVIAELSDAAGAFLVQAAHDDKRGGSGSPSRCDGERIRSILVLMKPARAASRRLLPTSPFRPAPPAPPAEQLAEHDQVTHDKYGLGRVVSVQDDATLVVDFGTRRVRFTMPCTKLAKL